MPGMDDIENCITQTVLDRETLPDLSGIWKKPLVRAVYAGDRQFALLKKAVSPSHLLPRDVLAGAQTVICFFIPFEDSVVKSNAADADTASPEWARAYIATNELIAAIGENLGALLEREGYHAGRIPATHNFDPRKLISDWSHRHVAYIAGMGTFGINNMLITERGCCGRFGSLVTDWDGVSHNGARAAPERCLNKRSGGCGICRKKCSAGAYPHGVFDRHICYERCLENARLYRDMGFADVCGKCLCALPCSSAAPR